MCIRDRGGAEAGHGHSQHIAGGAAQLFHGADGHQQSETAVQTARDADDRRLGDVYKRQALHRPAAGLPQHRADPAQPGHHHHQGLLL